MEHRPILMGLTALHQVATASWIGGMPYLLLALARSSEIRAAQFICRRFSYMAAFSLVVLVGAGWGMSLVYVGSVDAVYGTTYGAMLLSKIILLGVLLILGLLNFLIVRRLPADAASSLPHLRRFAEAELGIGFTLILAAASLTSQAPATDLKLVRVSASEIVERISPRWPRLVTPDISQLSPASPLKWRADANGQAGLQSFVPGASLHVNGPGDIAWSEYNHHWAGLIVLSVGLLAFTSRSNRAAWAKNWPLAFLGLAVFLFLRADPENWPLGPRSFWQSFAVADVLQHRLFVLLIIAFSIFEWSVQTGRTSGRRAALVFPAVCAAGGALLLTHSHSLGNIKEELLVEVSHIPLAILGVTAGWARWLELRLASDRPRYVLAWIWPVCFVLIGVVLLNYPEG
jgi:putative copper resistance protein D